MKNLMLSIFVISFAMTTQASSVTETYNCTKEGEQNTAKHKAVVTNFNNFEEWSLSLDGQVINTWQLVDCKTENEVRNCKLVVFEAPITNYSCTKVTKDSCTQQHAYCRSSSECCSPLTCWSNQCL